MASDTVYTQFKSAVDIGMGVIYMVVSYYASQTGYIVEEYGRGLVYTIALLFFLYGLFRIYRGYIALRGAMESKHRAGNPMQRFKEREAAIKQEEVDKTT